MKNHIIFPAILLALFFYSFSSKVIAQETTKSSILLADPTMQIESMEAANDMYNFKFDEADQKFRWFKLKYPKHPLPYFLIGLAEWWKMMPESEDERFDDRFLAYMDSSITMADKMYDDTDNEDEKVEAAFFLAAAYGFKGRLYSERKNWTKAAFAGKNSLKYLDKFKDKESLSIEFLFGDGLYNYYREWIPENYKSLKPILFFFDHGDKKKGIEQLRKVALNAFYTRTESQVFLMRIYEDEKDQLMAYQTAKYLYQIYPDNPFFHRYYARMCFSMGQLHDVQKEATLILDRIEKKQLGYGGTAGRYASYYMAYIYEHLFEMRDLEKAKEFYKKAITFSEETKAFESGYYHASIASLARIFKGQKNMEEAKKYYELLKDKVERKSPYKEEAEKFLKDYKKITKAANKAKKKK